MAALAVGAAVAAANGVANPGAQSAPRPMSFVVHEHGVGGDAPLHADEATALPRPAITAADAERRLQQLRASRAEQRRELDRQQAVAAAAEAEAARARAVVPLVGRLTSTFGWRWGTMHQGIDIAAPMLTNEYAAAAGVVLEAGPASGFGNVIYIEHDNGDVTVYGHMEEVLVEAGDVVEAGDLISLVGSRGNSTGPHLHFEVYEGGLNGQRVDPVPWLAERGAVL